jgi:hypothetical protein
MNLSAIDSKLQQLSHSISAENEFASKQAYVRDMKAVLERYRLEIKSLPAGATRDQFLGQLGKYQSDCKRFELELQNVHTSEKESLVPADDSAATLREYGLQVQLQTKDSLVRSLQRIEESRQTGQKSLEKLEYQRGILTDLHDSELAEIQKSLDHSGCVLRRMDRRCSPTVCSIQ